MTFKGHLKALSLLVTALTAILTMTVACSQPRTITINTPNAREATPTLSDVWAGMLQRTPYPYTTPLPPTQATALDGAYSKFDPKEGVRPFCRRCMPYPAEGGTWILDTATGQGHISNTFQAVVEWLELDGVVHGIGGSNYAL